MYVAALRLAPLSLVQAVSASGIAILALFSVHGHPGRLARHERLAVSIALIGLVLLAGSLVGSTRLSHTAPGRRGGVFSAKLITSGGIWLLALLTLVTCYAAGTSVLQAAFQHGSALTAAGIATLVTNAVPIAAGFVLFDESLPPGVRGARQVAAFGSIVASAALLGSSAATRSGSAARPDTDPEGATLRAS